MTQWLAGPLDQDHGLRTSPDEPGSRLVLERPTQRCGIAGGNSKRVLSTSTTWTLKILGYEQRHVTVEFSRGF
jgi:hypothetical protein